MATNKPATFVDMYWDEVRRYARVSGEGGERLSVQFVRRDPEFKYQYAQLREGRYAKNPNRSPNGAFARALVFFGYRTNEDWWDVGETPKVKAGTPVRETARETREIPTTRVPESREVREERRVRSERQRERDELEAERRVVQTYLDWLERQPPPRSGLKAVRQNLRAIERRLGEL